MSNNKDKIIHKDIRVIIYIFYSILYNIFNYLIHFKKLYEKSTQNNEK